MELEYFPTDYMIGDYFTKPLQGKKNSLKGKSSWARMWARTITNDRNDTRLIIGVSSKPTECYISLGKIGFARSNRNTLTMRKSLILLII
jgi:hypothetical protein